MRLIGLCLLGGCGNPSYWPKATGRSGLSGFCSDPDGIASGALVALNVVNTVPLALIYWNEDCIEGDFIELPKAYQGYQDSVPPGSTFTVENLDGGILGNFTVPFDVTQWTVQVPQ